MSRGVFKPESAGGIPMVPTCCKCGGREVWVSTNGVVWSNRDQRWCLDNDDDATLFCNECEEIDSFVWVSMVGPTPGQRLIDVT